MKVNYEMVDLGLPSGLKWAKFNLGANTLGDCGEYFMFGATTPSTNNACDWASAPFNNGSDEFNEDYFNAHKSEWFDGEVLKPKYDAATQIMGSQYRMPTVDEVIELYKNTTSKWVTVNCVLGKVFTSKINGNSIFFPISRFRVGSHINYDTQLTNIWSSTISDSCKAWGLMFSSILRGEMNFNRDNGCCIRAVCK